MRDASRSRARRRHGSIDSDAGHVSINDREDLATVVDVGPYSGVLGTLWRIVREEGETVEVAPLSAARLGQLGASNRKTPQGQKGQGVLGLWRGWRVGMWGIIGVWGAAAMSTAGPKGGEF